MTEHKIGNWIFSEDEISDAMKYVREDIQYLVGRLIKYKDNQFVYEKILEENMLNSQEILDELVKAKNG